MSIATELSRIQTDRNTIRNKLIELGLATITDNLDALAAAIEGIVKQGAVAIEVKEGETYTIPAGYHSGTGTVAGVAGGGNYTLQQKSVTPTKAKQNVVSDEGYYGLSGVEVAPIPDAYHDVTSVTSGEDDVLTGKIYVNSKGVVTPGKMPNNGAVNITLDTFYDTYNIPEGYHNGMGMVSLQFDSNTVTPTKSKQIIYPRDGFVLYQVTVEAIPDNYIDTSAADAAAGHILLGKKVYVNGVLVTGTMANNGSISKTIDGLSTVSASIPAGYTTGGTVSLTSDIEEALAAI